MKKIALCSLMMCLGFVANSFAECKIENCAGRGNDCLGAYDFNLKAKGSTSEAYVCERGHCGDGTILISPNLDKAYICVIKQGFFGDNFMGLGDDAWENYYSKINWCSAEQIRILRNRDVHGNWVFYSDQAPKHAKKAVVNTTNNDYHSKNDSGNALVFTSRNICFAYTCEYGYTASADGKQCVEGISGGGEGAVPVAGGNCPDGQIRATKDISVIGVCTGSLCTPIKTGQCYDKDFLKCMEAVDRGEAANWNGTSCNCGDKKVWNKKTYTCVANNGGSGKTCAQLYGKYPERLACCQAGSLTRWSGSVSNGTCTCKDTNTKWQFDAATKKGQCVANTVAVQGDCKYHFNGTVYCANGQSMIIDKEYPVSAAVLNGKSCSEFNSMYQNDLNTLRQFFDELCPGATTVAPSAPAMPAGPSASELAAAQSSLSAFFKTTEENKSVWKTTDGKFNSARLASDLTAGVVLGTVGGVVSGVVIKKNQVKKGFEALHCTVGGQTVADWGDEFSVGLRR